MYWRKLHDHAVLLGTVPIGSAMRNLLHSRRGSVALATVVALVPMIGALALGAEAGTWYITKQKAQAAADAAAYSGALKLACSLAPSSCIDAKSVDYRG